MSKSIRIQALGFGFIYEESQHHFLVEIPKSHKSKVIIYERFRWQEGVEVQNINPIYDTAKVELSKHKWDLIKETLRQEFNERLKSEKIIVGSWKQGQVPVERKLGKEMVLLAWAIEDADPNCIDIAIKNWLGFTPEERWWLFTMTNAATGNLKDNNKGWRKAIRFALTENPTEVDTKQLDIFDYLWNKNN